MSRGPGAVGRAMLRALEAQRVANMTWPALSTYELVYKLMWDGLLVHRRNVREAGYRLEAAGKVERVGKSWAVVGCHPQLHQDWFEGSEMGPL